ncbi:TetR family transcriptional regulator [Streptomyces angustmyceticus]|uniref:TetR family transcriptional regulator n=1 Tax=Streptomyces angustmyceticus TaxID=285578 RepID=A0A5J4LGA8_9ACTN|nr:TetR family transcriptional regulator [Streptomyces angustmyceticus]UAL67775.1 TetR family transcriptional regulator [Streptomyces angustmyceticus]GES31112.1 TetR family transcriptional regulator [Streptomyces angustmyceticus]
MSGSGQEPDDASAPGAPPAPARRRGRPARAAAETGPGARERILAAARAEFAERGYDKTSVRGIAKAAGVDAALVHHYFGTKEQVFAAAIELTFAPALTMPDALAGGGADVGERMARFMFGVWENPVSRPALLAIMRSALTNDKAAAVLRGLIERRMLQRVAGELDVPDPEFRAQLAAGHLIGIAMLRYVIKMDPVASADTEEIIAMVAPALQRYLTQP